MVSAQVVPSLAQAWPGPGLGPVPRPGPGWLDLGTMVSGLDRGSQASRLPGWEHRAEPRILGAWGAGVLGLGGAGGRWGLLGAVGGRLGDGKA